MPKNAAGVRPVKRPVAKHRPLMGRLVATANPMAKARIIHSRCRLIARRTRCQDALLRANTKTRATSVVAAACVAPPIDGIATIISSADTPITKAQMR